MTEPQLIIQQAAKLVILTDFDEKTGPKIEKEIPVQQPTCVRFNGPTAMIGSSGQISLTTWESGQTRQIKTPHRSNAIACSDSFAVTEDGVVFSMESGAPAAFVSDPLSIQPFGSTVFVFGKSKIQLFEATKRPICSYSRLQPPEPFTDAEFACPAAVLFAAPNAIYSFNISLSEISNVGNVKDKISKIEACHSAVSVLYSGADGDRIRTYVARKEQQCELGIDVTCDHRDRTWCLQKKDVVVFARKLLSLNELFRVPLDELHSYNRIFRMGETIGLYASPSGDAVWLSEARQFLAFEAPPEVTMIQWPAMVTPTCIYICSYHGTDYSTLLKSDYTQIPAVVSSCCWLARTLFAVEGRNIITVSAFRTKKRVIDALPNAMCAIAAALPSELVFVTALPDLRVLTIRQPFIQTVALADLYNTDLAAFRYMIYYMPKLPVDPAAVASLSPMFAMSVFNKSPPKYVNDDVIRI
jgi:hypothetical protein